jgi:hypothetical protein
MRASHVSLPIGQNQTRKDMSEENMEQRQIDDVGELTVWAAGY